MKIVELNRSAQVSGKQFAPGGPVAVTEEEFDQLFQAGALQSVDVPVRDLLPEKLRKLDWFDLRAVVAGKISRSRSKSAEVFCDRAGIPKMLLPFLRLTFEVDGKENGTDS